MIQNTLAFSTNKTSKKTAHFRQLVGSYWYIDNN